MKRSIPLYPLPPMLINIIVKIVGIDMRSHLAAMYQSQQRMRMRMRMRCSISIVAR